MELGIRLHSNKPQSFKCDTRTEVSDIAKRTSLLSHDIIYHRKNVKIDGLTIGKNDEEFC